MAKYPPTGPFSNNNPPGYGAAFGNNVEQFMGYAADSKVTTDGSSGLSLDKSYAYQIGGFTIVASPNLTDLFINCPNTGGGHHLYLQIGGVNLFRLDATTGNVTIKGTLTQNGTP